MKLRIELQKSTQDLRKSKKPRFKIEKLEERIAPHHRFGHYRGDCHYRLGGCGGRPR